MFKHVVTGARRRWPFLLFGGLVLSCVLFAGLWLGAASAGSKHAQAHFAFHGVKMSKFDAAESNEAACATPSFTDVPNSATTFKLGGTAARNVLVNVSVSAAVGPDSVGDVQVVIDGVVQGIAPLGVNNFGNSNEAFVTASNLNLTSALAPGSLTVKLQFALENGPEFCLENWTYAILHA